MFRNLTLAKKLILGFALVLLVSSVVTGFAIMYMNRIASNTDTMFRHPYTATATALQAQARVTAMAREMKDLILTTDMAARKEHINKVNELNDKVLADFDTLYERFLGDTALIDAALKAFHDWEPIRNEVFRFLDLGLEESAAHISRNEGTAQIQLVERAIQEVVRDAMLRAENFNHEAQRSAASATSTVVGLMVVACAAAVLATFLITKSITKPAGELLALTNEIANGNLAVADVDYKSKDEIGRLTEAMNRMKADLRELVGSVRDSVRIVRSSAEQMASGAQETSASVEELASSANEFASAVDRLSQNTQEMSLLAAKSNELATNGSTDIERTVQSMNEINEVVSALATEIKALGHHSEEIGKIVALITGIADQTNLLALNAAIEAARAGEQGRGFAVVAEEVRQLAEQSAKAAGEITQLIQRIREAVHASVDRAGEGTQKVREGMEVVAHTGSTFGEIASAIEALSRGIADVAATSEELAAGAEEMGATTEQQSASAEQMAASAAEVARAAETVDTQMRRFQV